jgi:hypothetical protein
MGDPLNLFFNSSGGHAHIVRKANDIIVRAVLSEEYF